MMKSFIILHILVSAYVGGQSTPPNRPTGDYEGYWDEGECCMWKMVGGRTYRLVERTDEAFDYLCTTDCVYMTEGSDVKFCFKPGGLESECFDEGGTWPSGSYPPMTGGPPGSNMTEGPMTGGPTGEPTGSATGSPGGGGSGTTANNAAYCSQNQEHTMCKYPGPSSSCSTKTIFRELSSAAKDAILAKHNELRRRVAKGEETGGINSPQPGASNMKKMVWNVELEAIAQRWADQCTFGHDSVREKLDGTSVGQNAYWGGNSQQQDEAAVQGGMTNAAQNWYDEVTDPGFDSQTINPYTFNSGTGHYTQVVWAATEELGCGMVYYQGDSFFENLIVCNYAVAGNLIGSEMYKAGTACADCPSGYTCDDGLCAKS